MPRSSQYKKTFRDLNDGIVKGRIEERMGECGICHTDKQLILRVESVTLPTVGGVMKKGKLKGAKKMKPHHSLILYRTPEEQPPGERVPSIDYTPEPVLHIGITCGCYSKAHRQLARIDQRMKDRQ